MANELPKLSEIFELDKQVTYAEAVEQAWLPQDAAMLSVPSISPIETVLLENNKITPTVALLQISYSVGSNNVLNFIDYSNLRDGAVIQLRIQDDTFPVTIKNGVVGDGSIMTTDGNDITLTDYRKIVQFQREGSVWRQVGGIQMQADLTQADDTRPDFVKGKELLVTKVNNITPINGNVDTYPNQTNITNCITEISQDIKLELVDGVLTLKAGSKVYVPNGAGKFDEVVVSTDKTLTAGWGTPNEKMLLFYHNNGLMRIPVNRSVSGASDSYTAASTHFWYDTTNNIMKEINAQGAVNQENYSLPLCIFTATGDDTASVASIDQVFNGFGKIGSTAFVLPGVKGLIPNGRNADGTLKNIEFTVSSVVTTTFSETQNDVDCVLQGTTIWARNQTVVKSASEIGTATGNFYIIDDNIFVYSTAGSLTNPISRIVIGKISLSSGVITSFTPKLPFRAVDYNEVKSLGATITYWE